MSRARLPKGRPGKRRSRGKRVLIACNADITEPAYFTRLRERLGLSPGLIEINKSEKGKDPHTLVEAAGKMLERDASEARKEGFDPYAHVWAVTDTDEFSVGEAQREARRLGVGLALSNPCFEVWLIDHVGVCPSSCFDTASCERVAIDRGVVVPTEAKRRSRSKMKAVNFAAIEGNLENALKNAARHNSEQKRLVREGDPDNKAAYAVWTDIPQIVEELRSLA